jgi:transcriptional regulator with XRE-family HTH domain
MSNAVTLAERLRGIGISESYASQLANGRRPPSLRLAIRIYRELGIKLGPLAHATAAEIAALERVSRKASQVAA